MEQFLEREADFTRKGRLRSNAHQKVIPAEGQIPDNRRANQGFLRQGGSIS